MNEADSPQGQQGREYICPHCGATFFDDDYEDGDSCMPCTAKWLEAFYKAYEPAIAAAAQLLRDKRRGRNPKQP